MDYHLTLCIATSGKEKCYINEYDIDRHHYSYGQTERGCGSDRVFDPCKTIRTDDKYVFYSPVFKVVKYGQPILESMKPFL